MSICGPQLELAAAEPIPLQCVFTQRRVRVIIIRGDAHIIARNIKVSHIKMKTGEFALQKLDSAVNPASSLTKPIMLIFSNPLFY